MTPPKIIFVLLHSAFHTPKCWDRLSAEIEEAGFSSVAPALPSSIPGSTVPVSGWDEDVKAIRETVSSLVRESDVVVVMHGTRGLSGGTALEGLDKQSRMSQGLQGGVIRLVYIASYPMREWFQHRILGYNTPGNGPYPVVSVWFIWSLHVCKTRASLTPFSAQRVHVACGSCQKHVLSGHGRRDRR